MRTLLKPAAILINQSIVANSSRSVATSAIKRPIMTTLLEMKVREADGHLGCPGISTRQQQQPSSLFKEPRTYYIHLNSCTAIMAGTVAVHT